MKATTTMPNGPAGPELGHARVFSVPLRAIKPSPENDALYRPIDPASPEMLQLIASVSRDGVKEPLVLSLDGYIISGHRRHAAASAAGLDEVPARYEDIRRGDDGFTQLLAVYNQQRIKSPGEQAREGVALAADPDEAHGRLLAYRRQEARFRAKDSGLEVRAGGVKRRHGISRAKRPFLDAAVRAIEEARAFWPLSVRGVHYRLLNDPPLRNARRPSSRYRNDKAAYDDLSDILTRARLAGLVPMEALDDETRPVTVLRSYPGVGPFVRQESAHFLCWYARDLQAGQPLHIEVVCEKMTVGPIVEPVCAQFCLPLTIGRGYMSIPPRRDIAERFRLSGKAALQLVVVSDADPEGESIAESLAGSMRDDFHVPEVRAVKACLTPAQARRMGLPTALEAKETSSRRKGFVARHGAEVWELESLPPAELRRLVREAVESVLDHDAFNREVEAEKDDAAELEAVRAEAMRLLGGLVA
jgi:ParB-like chromosome segregation protein Spo0J